MNKKQLIEKLTSLKAEVIEFNSNNGWNFGGVYGKRYKLKNMTITVATACYRHLKPNNFIRVDLNGEKTFHGIIDLHQTPSAFEKVNKYIDENYK